MWCSTEYSPAPFSAETVGLQMTVSSALCSRKPSCTGFLQQMAFVIWYKIYRQPSATWEALKVSDEATNKWESNGHLANKFSSLSRTAVTPTVLHIHLRGNIKLRKAAAFLHGKVI